MRKGVREGGRAELVIFFLKVSKSKRKKNFIFGGAGLE